MNRKIPLDIHIYNPYTGISSGGKEDCDHDYPPTPTRDEATFAEWVCSKCGMKRSYEVYD
jgi:hypothetical protein